MAEIKVRLKSGEELVLNGSKWTGPAQAAAKANQIAQGGDWWHPARGQPGYALALEVAKQLGGQAILPPVPPSEPGIVH